MSGFFDPNGGVMGFLGKVFDVILLSIIWTIFSLPVITVGASTTALYYSCVKAIRRERGYIFREFWHSFKANFFSATILWVPFSFLLWLFYNVNIKYAMEIEGTPGFILLCVYCMLAFILLCTGVYMFPVLSRFTMGRIQTIKISFFMSLRHFPRTIVLLVIVVVSVLAMRIMPLFAMFLPAVSAILFSLLMEPVLKKYTPKSEGEELKDEWYLE